MRQEDFDEKTLELIERVSVDLAQECHRLSHSGACDMENHDDDYGLPKIVLCAALYNMAEKLQPFSPEYKREVKNLRKF